MSINGPIPLLILPDGILTGRANVASVTSEKSPFCAPAVAGSSNLGDLLPSLTSPSLSADYAFDLQVQRAGGVYSLAEWIWKNSTDASGGYRGVDEVRYLARPHDPFQPIGSSHPVASATPVLCGVYASRIGSIFLYAAGGSTSTLYIRHRAIGSDAEAWTLDTVNLGAAASLKTTKGGIEVLEMPDGSLRMLVVTGSLGTANNDVSVYSSQDGLTFTLCSRNVVSKAYGSQFDILRMRAAVSGDWIRMVCVDASGPHVRSFVSSDRGASFTWLQNSDMTGATMPEDNGMAVDPYGHLDVEGVGDASGTFVLCYRLGTNTILKARFAARDADWSEETSLVNTTEDIYNATLVQDGMRMYLHCITANTVGGIFIESSYVSLDRVLDEGFYGYTTNFEPWDESVQYMPTYVAAVKADPGFAVMWSLCNLDSSGSAVYGQTALQYGRGWTVRSLWQDENELPPSGGFANDFMTVRWDANAGTPLRSGSTQVAYWNGVSGVTAWNSDRFRYGSDATGANGRSYHAYNEGATPTKPWVSNLAYIGWIVGALTTTLNGVANDRCAVRVRALGTLTAGVAGCTYDLSFRHGVTQFVVFDNNAGAALATISATLASNFYAVRVGFGVSGTTQAEIAIAPLQSMASVTGWSTATVTPTSAVGATFQGYEWGHLVGLAGLTSNWRRIEHNAVGACNQFGYSNPTSLRGAPCAAQPVYLNSNVYASWSGGAGFEGDSWTAEPRHAGEVENIFLPSPDAPWIGTSLTTQSIVLVANASTTTDLFDHAAIGIFGTATHRVLVEYNATNSWGSPSYATGVTNDITPALRVTSTAAGSVLVAGATLDDGEYVGKYARTEKVGDSVCSFSITRQVGNTLYLAPSGGSLATMAFSAGSSLYIHDDKFVIEHPAREQYAYMRLTFPCPPGTTTATLDIRAGVLLAGATMDFPTAINWEHTGAEAPNVELSEGDQGLRWGYQRGQSRRSVEGTIRGDAARNRRILANQLRALSQFGARPLVFAWDKDDLQRSALYVRHTGTIEYENVGWKRADDGSWFPVGDMKIAFSEEL